MPNTPSHLLPRPQTRPPRRSRRPAFTLIELLVVVAIMGLLVALLVPNLSRARAQARTTVCGANLHSLGIATTLYLQNNAGYFFRYYTDYPAPADDIPAAGRLWWFGFETGGPGTGTLRPLDKSISPLGPYLPNLSNKIQCPEFPYDDPAFFPKFNAHAASYGLNLNLAPPFGARVSVQNYATNADTVFSFADGLHFDFNPGFNEAHYIQYASSPVASGYAHFRHNHQTQFVLLDGHVESQPLPPTALIFRTIAGPPTANLPSPSPTNPSALYGN